jgi:hypothetical protein
MFNNAKNWFNKNLILAQPHLAALAMHSCFNHLQTSMIRCVKNYYFDHTNRNYLIHSHLNFIFISRQFNMMFLLFKFKIDLHITKCNIRCWKLLFKSLTSTHNSTYLFIYFIDLISFYCTLIFHSSPFFLSRFILLFCILFFRCFHAECLVVVLSAWV